MTTLELLRAARRAWPRLAAADAARKDAALDAMARRLLDGEADILAANREDVEAARGSISEVMIDRLRLTPERVRGMADGIRRSPRSAIPWAA